MADAEDNVSASITDARQRTNRRFLTAVASIGTVAIIGAIAYLVVIPGLQPQPKPDQQQRASSGRCGPNATPETCPERQRFIDAAREFSTEIESQLETMSLSRWAPTDWEEIQGHAQDGNDAFAATRYIEALASMQAAIEQGREQIRRAAETFIETLAEAQQLFRVGDAQAAADAIDLATTIDPNHEEAQALARRIAVLPQVLEHLEAASIARVENRSAAEIEALQAVLQLDPERQSTAARLQELAQTHRELRFGNAVRNAERAVQRGDFASARQFYQRARGMGLGRDLDSLLRRIEDGEKTLYIRQLISTAQTYVRDDAWDLALGVFDEALALEPGNATAVEGRADAQAIIQSLKRLKPFIIDPLRATDRNIKAGPNSPANILRSLAPLQGKSTLLDGLIAQVRQTVAQAEQPAQVRVISDGNTYVRVLRVGQVGRRRETVISLKPGNYSLEGERSGFRNVLVPLQVPLGASNLDVRVMCRERI